MAVYEAKNSFTWELSHISGIGTCSASLTTKLAASPPSSLVRGSKRGAFTASRLRLFELRLGVLPGQRCTETVSGSAHAPHRRPLLAVAIEAASCAAARAVLGPTCTS